MINGGYSPLKGTFDGDKAYYDKEYSLNDEYDINIKYKMNCSNDDYAETLFLNNENDIDTINPKNNKLNNDFNNKFDILTCKADMDNSSICNESHKEKTKQMIEKSSLIKKNNKTIFYLNKDQTNTVLNSKNNNHHIKFIENKIKVSVPSVVSCTCKQSKCIKLYCECFANGSYCVNCACKNCFNLPKFEDVRVKSIKILVNKNKFAFKPKVDSESTKHLKGCKCVNSNCLKNYCECFQNSITCNENCKCKNCKNYCNQKEMLIPSKKGKEKGKLVKKTRIDEETNDNSNVLNPIPNVEYFQ